MLTCIFLIKKLSVGPSSGRSTCWWWDQISSGKSLGACALTGPCVMNELKTQKHTVTEIYRLQLNQHSSVVVLVNSLFELKAGSHARQNPPFLEARAMKI